MKYMDCWANLNICTSKKTFTPRRTLSGGITFDGDFILFTYNFTDGRDLDTRTQIRLTTGEGLPHGGNAGNMMGWGRSGSDLNGLLKWGGDNLGTGFEAVLVNLRGIRAAYPGMVDIQVGLAAFWYGSRGSQPVSIKATLWKGGTPIHGGFSWTNPTATETVWVRSGRKAIQSHRRDRGNNGQQIATFTFNFPTYNGRFECWGGNCLHINNGD